MVGGAACASTLVMSPSGVVGRAVEIGGGPLIPPNSDANAENSKFS